MKTFALTTIAAIAFSLASPSWAAPVSGTATLAAAARAAEVTTEAAVWHCDGTSCTGLTPAMTGSAVAACSSIADANGRVAAFTAGATSFGEPELKRCNRHVKP